MGVRSVPLLPDRHSTTIDGTRFLSRLNTADDVVSIVLPLFNSVGSKCMDTHENEHMTALYPLLTISPRSVVEEGGLAPAIS